MLMMTSLYDSRSRSQSNAETDGTDDGFWAREAVAEAERILSETEPEEDGEYTTTGACGICDGWYQFAGRVCANDYGQCIYVCGCHAEKAILAASLAAVLPVLDEMAWGPVDALAFESPDHFVRNDEPALAILDRNRATLDAMGGR